MNDIVQVHPVDASLREAVIALAVQPGQDIFVGTVADSLADVAVCPGSEALALLEEGGRRLCTH